MKLAQLPPHWILLLHAALTASLAALAASLALPSALLHALHTYVLPDSPSPHAPRAALRPPSATHNHRPKTKDQFDESAAQIFRLRLAHDYLRTRSFFPHYNLSAILAVLAFSNLLLRRALLPSDDIGSSSSPLTDSIPILSWSVAVGAILVGLIKVSFEKSASKRLDRQLSVFFGGFGFLFAFLVVFVFAPFVFDFKFDYLDGFLKIVVSILAGCLCGILFMPAGKAARVFWLGTDQLRWNLSVISCGKVARILFYASFLLSMFTSLLWMNPIIEILVKKDNGVMHGAKSEVLACNVGMVRSDFVRFRGLCLLLSAVLQLILLRPSLQMWLNEAVFSWYQRLHASKVPDLDFSRAKIFLYNHYLCLTALQFFAFPALVLLFGGLSQMHGTFPFICSSANCSSAVKEVAAFLAWWVIFVWIVFSSAGLAMYRVGFSYIL